MPPTILSSPLLSLPGINTILADPKLSMEDRIGVLAAKISLLQNDPSTRLPRLAPPQPASGPPAVGTAGGQARPGAHGGVGQEEAGPSRTFGPIPSTTLELLDARLELAQTYLSITPAPKFTEAESELTLVDGESKRLTRVAERQAALAARAAEANGKSVAAREEDVLRSLRRARVQALEMLVGVEEGLGRHGRAKRWTETLDKLRSEGH